MWGGQRGKGNMMGTEVIDWLERHQTWFAKPISILPQITLPSNVPSPCTGAIQPTGMTSAHRYDSGSACAKPGEDYSSA